MAPTAPTTTTRDAKTAPGRRAWAAALGRECNRHGAPPGVPCWSLPTGLCSARIKAAGFSWPPPADTRGTPARERAGTTTPATGDPCEDLAGHRLHRNRKGH